MKKRFAKLLWLFLFGSFAGFVVEMVYRSYVARRLIFSPGLVYGPLIPIYGVGVIVLVFAASKMKNERLIFFNCAVLGGVMEYICSVLQEVIFNTISWDYSNRFLNIHGRTSLFHVFWWGILGYVFIKYIYPQIIKLFNKIDYKKVEVLTLVMTIFMAYNIFISVAAGLRQEQRKQGVVASNTFQEYLDERFSDEVMDGIFISKKSPN